jgi:hypothetical protein
VLFHIEHRCGTRWEAFGSGEGGDGEEASTVALADLNSLAGGTLPSGEYRMIAARSDSTHWDFLQLGAGGEITAGDEGHLGAETSMGPMLTDANSAPLRA